MFETTATDAIPQEEKFDNKPLWFVEKRLPTTGEIRKNKNGFPPVEQEAALKEFFIQHYKKQILDSLTPLLLKYRADYDVTEEKLMRVIGFCYGIYFYNFISKGRIFNPKLNPGCLAKAEYANTDIVTLNDEDLVPKLSEWPVIFTPGSAPETVASFDSRDFLIRFDMIYFMDGDLEKQPMTLYEGSETNVTNPDQENIPEIDDDDRLKEIENRLAKVDSWLSLLPQDNWSRYFAGGMEETSHADMRILRTKRFPERIKKLVRLATEGPNEISNFEDLDDLFKLDFTLKNWPVASSALQTDDYYTYNGVEFASAVVNAMYIKKYLPKLWQDSYGNYFEDLKEKRLLMMKHLSAFKRNLLLAYQKAKSIPSH